MDVLLDGAHSSYRDQQEQDYLAIAGPIQSSSRSGTDRKSGSPVSSGQRYFCASAAANASAYAIGYRPLGRAASQISSSVGTSIVPGSVRDDSRHDSASISL